MNKKQEQALKKGIRDAIVSRLNQLEYFNVDFSKPYKQSGVDSLDILDITIALESQYEDYDINLNDEDFQRFNILNNLIEITFQKIKESSQKKNV